MRGGKRAGAGRRAGSKSKSTIEREAVDKERLEQAKANGISPLEVMLTNMRRHFASEQWAEAQDCAKDAAPYIHPRLANIEATGKEGGPLEIVIRKLTDAPSSTSA